MPRFFCAALALALACAFGGPPRPPAEPPPNATAEPCEPQDCGPAPVTSPWLCADGTVSGATGRCLRDDRGSCRWEKHACAELVPCGLAGVSCPAGYQCLDDPRDDCDPSERGSSCPGLCARR